MKQPISTSTINLNKSYYENFKSNRIINMISGAKLKRVMKTSYITTVFPVTLGGYAESTYDGVDIKDYVKNTFNGDSPDCIAEKIANNASKAWEDTKAEAGRFLNKITGGKTSWKDYF